MLMWYFLRKVSYKYPYLWHWSCVNTNCVTKVLVLSMVYTHTLFLGASGLFSLTHLWGEACMGGSLSLLPVPHCWKPEPLREAFSSKWPPTIRSETSKWVFCVIWRNVLMLKYCKIMMIRPLIYKKAMKKIRKVEHQGSLILTHIC